MRGRGTFALLVRHFVGRFFTSEHARSEDALRERAAVAVAVATVVAPCLFFLLLHFYFFMLGPPDKAWTFGAFFFGLAMIASGMVAALAWDELFLDEVDQAVLSLLPLRTGSLLWAKATAVAMLLLSGAVVLTGTTSLVFAFELEPFQPGPLPFPRLALAYFTGGFLACVTVFCACATLRGATLILPRWRRVRRASAWLQSGTIILLLASFALLPTATGRLFALKEHGSLAVFAIPPAWFIGVTQTLAGHRDAVFARLALLGWAAPAVAAGLLLVLVPAGIPRFSRTLENKDGGRTGPGRRAILDGCVNRWLIRDPLARAAFWFFTLTLWRSRRQRVRFLVFAGMAAGWVVFCQADGPQGLRYAAAVVAFLAVAGAHSASQLVCQDRAVWLVRLTEVSSKRAYEWGIRWGLWLAVLAPAFIILGAVLAALEAVPLLPMHLAYHLLAACLLAEAVAIGRPYFPFTRLPASEPMTRALFLVGGLWAYGFLLSGLEGLLLSSAHTYLAACGLELVALAAVILVRGRRGTYEFVYEENADVLSYTLAGPQED